ncbi:NADH dehydrogenase [ubiquinone] 1 beta subcomplex subunit 3 [Parasteatoda tepidariorum]|uniref:NADH dehydrogenase [ubiquinone] 1 beta subcomplex subunit 3 n=1 Tax=Parasteatoda tepidariorum TaxID=114398 RepID=A0A2L2Y7C6_PARTP|nr:NADH dehydrogenase [ubiquinone] 1 beta subcomplex subunit 3 [Parasteatoda tepidariorum]
MGGGHHVTPPKIPDYRIYKVEDIPHLMRTKLMLEKQGLKDPWLRNEVWRYPPESQLGMWGPLREVIFRKVGLGFGLAVLTIIGEKIYHHYYPPKEHHHH